MDWTLEVVVIPVADVERAKAFYSERLGFQVDVDNAIGNGYRNVQLTPPGSSCSVTIGTGLTAGLQLCVTDIAAAHAELVERGVAVSPIRHVEDGAWQAGRGGPWNSFFFFQDPDGNDWAVQEKPARS